MSVRRPHFIDALKRSLTAQISLSIAVISILLVAGSGLMITRLATRELRWCIGKHAPTLRVQLEMRGYHVAVVPPRKR